MEDKLGSMTFTLFTLAVYIGYKSLSTTKRFNLSQCKGF